MNGPERFLACLSRCRPGVILAAAVFLCTPATASPGPDPAQLCEMAAARASAATGVPLDVLRAIALTESGRRRDGALRPWPWTVNIEGTGRWFETRDAAEAHIAAAQRRGAISFDIGCFQINHRWHGAAFASVSEMFDPGAGAAYAARFLTRLHAELGDWSAAAGAYHSRTETLAARYRARFDRIRAGLGEAGAAPPPQPAATTRTNRFPLLLAQPAAERRPGSLVPLVAADGPGLIALD